MCSPVVKTDIVCSPVVSVPYKAETNTSPMCLCWAWHLYICYFAVIGLLKCCLTCHSGWLEPLLDRIAENRSNVVAPIIDVLADDTLKYTFSSARSTSVGGFDWNLQFNWHAIPERERKRRKNDVDPVWLSFSAFLVACFCDFWNVVFELVAFVVLFLC